VERARVLEMPGPPEWNAIGLARAEDDRADLWPAAPRASRGESPRPGPRRRERRSARAGQGRRDTGDRQGEVSRDREPAHVQRARGGPRDEWTTAVDGDVEDRHQDDPARHRDQHQFEGSASESSRLHSAPQFSERAKTIGRGPQGPAAAPLTAPRTMLLRSPLRCGLPGGLRGRLASRRPSALPEYALRNPRVPPGLRPAAVARVSGMEQITPHRPETRAGERCDAAMPDAGPG